MSLKEQLFTYSNTYITLDQFEKLSKTKTYVQFAEEIKQLEEEGIIHGVKSAKQNGKTPSLFYKYRLQKSKLRQSIHQQIERTRLHLHPAIQLDDYFRLSPKQWHDDLPYIEKISDYLQTNEFPTEEVPAPERSLSLVGDEKWIQEKGGAKLLERINVWDQLKIVPVHDPLSFALNPSAIGNEYNLHLIVENKTTFDGLIGALMDTPFTSLIYGQGYKITKSIEHFSRQLPLKGTQVFYYFGDVDWEGIKIWHLLNGKIKAIPAIPFYEAAITKQSIPVEKKQTANEEANEAFFAQLTKDMMLVISETLKKNEYFPQEVLSSKQLKEIWRDSDWNIPLNK